MFCSSTNRWGPDVVVANRTFSHAGVQCRLDPDYFSDERPPTEEELRRGRFTDAEVIRVLDLCEAYWRQYLDLGFDSFGVDDGATRVYEVRFDRSLTSTASANDGRMTIGASAAGDNVNLDRLKGTVLHELFHACQFASASGRRFGDSFGEGSADVATVLVEPDLRGILGVPSSNVYLSNPGETMWDRPSPGRPESSRSTPTLFWLYFCERLGTRNADPGRNMDALRDLMQTRFDVPDTAWRGVRSPAATGSFLGNGDVQLLMRSDDRRRLGLLSANRSYGGAGETHALLVAGERWGDGWRFGEADRFAGVGDILGIGRDQVVLQSEAPAYLGVVGFSEADGSPSRPTAPETHVVVHEQSRWGEGWRVREKDRVVAVGRFSDSPRAGILIQSEGPAYLGCLEVAPTGVPFTRAVVAEGQPLGEGGWVLDPGDTVVGRGDYVGNGREQFIIQREAPKMLGIIGIDEAGNFHTHAVVDSARNDRFGSGWRLRAGDRVVGSGRFFVGPHRDQILIQSSDPGYIGLVGLDDSGATETRFVAPSGGELGDDWTWNDDDVILGIDDFVGRGRDQFAVMSRRRHQLGIIGFGRDHSVYTYERTHDGHGRELPDGDLDGLATGDFAGLGTAQILVTGDRWAKLLSHEEPYLDEDDPDDEEFGRWRSRWHLGRNGEFFSSHRFLDDFIRDRTDGALDFERLWRDFTVTNITKDLAGVSDAFRYGFDFAGDSQRIQPDAFAVGQARRLERWSAQYYSMTSSSSGQVTVEGAQRGNRSHLGWAAIVFRPGSIDRLISLATSVGESFEVTVDVQHGDTVALIVTASYAPSVIDAHAVMN